MAGIADIKWVRESSSCEQATSETVGVKDPYYGMKYFPVPSCPEGYYVAQVELYFNQNRRQFQYDLVGKAYHRIAENLCHTTTTCVTEVNAEVFIQMINAANKKMQTSFDTRIEKMQTSFDTQIQNSKIADERMKTFATEMEAIHYATFWICFIAGFILLAKMAMSKSMQANTRLFYDKSRRKFIKAYVAVCSSDDEEENGETETVHIFEETITADNRGEF